jgi:hypothetical protein
MVNDAALGEFLSLVFLPYVPTLGGAVMGAILSLYIVFMLEQLINSFQSKKRQPNVPNSRPVQGTSEQ